MPHDDTSGQEPEAPESATTDAAPTDSAPEDRQPPWERTGEPFDPQRAWNLIERLRADLTTARTPGRTSGRETNRGQAAAPAPPAAPSATDAPDVSAQLAALRSELTRERVARRFGLDDDLVELLGDGDEQQITARAKTLADRLAKPATPSPVPRRPVEQLRGGADPTVEPGGDRPGQARRQGPARRLTHLHPRAAHARHGGRYADATH